MIKIDDMPRRIAVGRTLDNGYSALQIDCGEWVKRHPQLTEYRIEVKRTDGEMYFADTTFADSVLTWNINAADTAIAGDGEFQVVAIGTDGERKTSSHPIMFVSDIIAGTAAETPPEANKAWTDKVIEETRKSAAQAAASAADAKKTLESIPEDYKELAQEVGKLSEDIDTRLVKKIQSVNLISSYEFTSQRLLADGTIEDSTIYVLTDYIACEGGRTLSLTRIVGGSYGAYVRGKSQIYSIAFYDRDKSLISVSGGTSTVITDVDFKTPAGTAYVRVCFEKAYVATYQPMLEYSDDGISETFVEYFDPYYVYNENVDNEVANRRTQAVQTRLMSHIQSHQIRFPVPERPEFVKKSGQYNGCLSDIHTVDGVDVLYGFSGSTLVRSAPGTDYGSPNIRMTTASNNSTTNFVKKLDDGTLLVGVENADGAGVAKIFKGAPEVWNSSTSKFDVQWTEVLACETKNLRFSMWFGLSIYKNIVVVGEYGSNNVARNVYMSKDYGNTWSKIFTAELDNTGAGVHIHDVCYDPYSDVIWVCTGDGYWAQNIYWSYDGGMTWHKNYGYKESPSQFTQILPLPNCILFTSDSTKHMAVYRCMRDQVHRKMEHLELEFAYSYYDNYDAESPIGTNGCVVYGKDACVYFGWAERYDVAKTNSPVIATKDGYTFYEVWSDEDTSTMSSGYCGIYGVYGVSDKGNIAISYTNSEANTTNRHSIVMQAPEWKSWETMFE